MADREPDEFKHTHYYNPIGWDRFDARPHPGSSAIAPGSPVQNMGRMGPGKGGGKLAFHHIRDAAGNNQSVARASLMSKTQYKKHLENATEDVTSGDRQIGSIEAQEYFHDRRGEGRRDRPI